MPCKRCLKTSIELSRTKMQFVRYLQGQIDWNQRLIGITGARGVSKATML